MRKSSGRAPIIVSLIVLCLIVLFGCEKTVNTHEPDIAAPASPTPVIETVELSVDFSLETSVPALPTITPVPTPEPTPEPVPTPFTVVWMTDTQVYTRGTLQDVFLNMRDWILENREAKNIVFLAHTGDVVDGLQQAMYANASDALMPLLNVMPGAICCGNHDIGDSKRYGEFFKRDYVQATLQNEDTYQKNQCYYTTFSAGGDRFIVFSLGFHVTSNCFTWVKRVMDENPDAICIFLEHYGIEEDGGLVGPGKNFIRLSREGYPNAKLMLCGHLRGTAFYRDPDTPSGSTVMMYNYQDDRENGLGFLRLLTFDPEDRSIEVTTYSPWLDQFGYYKTSPEKDHFKIKNAY